MKKQFRFWLLILWLGLTQVSLYATHNRAGEITYRQLSPLTIELTITTYTKASSVAADRDSLDVNWGDGTTQFVRRDNSRTKFEPNDIKINYYVAQHTYPGVATYTVSFLDPNRISGILNVNYPNSIDIPFFLSTTFTLLDQQFQGFNNSAVLLQPPIDIGCVNKVFIHNPNAYDPDGDSLAYELTPPLQDINVPVPGYRYPNEVGTVSGNRLTINPTTGEIRWDSPKIQGEYNIAIKIKEYRNGRLINVILRDMQIFIKACDNEPPIIDIEDELCVVAGTTINLPISVSDPNTNQKVKLTATGGPFTIKYPARLEGPSHFTPIPFAANLVWETNCNHISNQYYQIVLRAVDNFYPDSTGLATLKTVRIKVVGPAPQNLETRAMQDGVLLDWDQPYACEVTENGFFQGFSIWRKETSTRIEPDTCNPGLSGGPYTKIVFKTLQHENGRYYHLDQTVEKGKAYCYRVLAEFAKLTLTGNPFNKVESLPSDESCIILKREAPLITKVSVENTDIANGQILIRWTKPQAEQLDTIVNPGPYTYEVWRSSDGNNYSTVHTQMIPYFNTNLDTVFLDSGLNTLAQPYHYKVIIRSATGSTFASSDATSVYLTTQPTDRQVNLTWSAVVPWANYQYHIFRKEATDPDFIQIATTETPDYQGKNLSNDRTYCYKIETIGTYAIQGIEDPIFNFSQEICSQPIDNVPPCPITIRVENICDRPGTDIDPDYLYNEIYWTHPFEICPEIAHDVAGYNIYFAASTEDTPIKIQTITDESELKYIHYPNQGLSGCYMVSSFDHTGNESELSEKICVDSCPFYELPNTFTPNGDGHNDIFKPTKNIFIHRIDFKVYNQWGNLVFETTDPEINWDGSTLNNKPLADGTYYYTCEVFENRVSGVEVSDKPLSGFIHLLRN
ncbi:MAG: gliding motility-associated C-terminal domain-containing protein [Chitinophagales bacterium]|nr:gliding motility-associated C-terminal domain-containing protein [Chitinophagales bacterium]